eukprot:scaffold10153_cov65-Phaeocystis_antarctica.AAC.2
MKQTRPVRELCTLRASAQMSPGYHPKHGAISRCNILLNMTHLNRERVTALRSPETDRHVSGARVLRVLSDDSFSHNSPEPHHFSSVPAGRPRRGGRASAVLAPHPPSSKNVGSR